jgi:hypothetical protein
MLPGKIHPRYRQLVTGKFEHQFQVLAGGLCVSRNLRAVKLAGESADSISAAIDDVYAFFSKYEKTLEPDIKVIFS